MSPMYSAMGLLPILQSATNETVHLLPLLLSLVIKLVPVFATFIFIATFHINITKGPMLGYIIYCQLYIVIAREGSQSYATFLAYSNLYKPIFKVAQILASVWSLDFSTILHK